jgi:mono/diheme cytochrome c family protein
MRLPSRIVWSSIAVSSLLVIVLASTTAQGQSSPGDGVALFKAKCAMCHGPDGAGKTPMGQKLNVRDLHSSEVQKESGAALSQMIAQGKGKMPAFDKALSPDQIKGLVAYIRELEKK